MHRPRFATERDGVGKSDCQNVEELHFERRLLEIVRCEYESDLCCLPTFTCRMNTFMNSDVGCVKSHDMRLKSGSSSVLRLKL